MLSDAIVIFYSSAFLTLVATATVVQRVFFKSDDPAGRAHRLRHWVIPCLAVLLFAGGFWGAQRSGRSADVQQRKELLVHAMAIARTINPERVKALSFTAADKDRPEFKRLRAQMTAYAEAMGLRSQYSMVLRDGKIVFGPESLAEDDPFASPPGTVYERPGPKDYEIFQTGLPMTQGPATDEYGTFITAQAPVLDPHTGDVLLVIGIDIEAKDWKAAVDRARLVPILFTLTLLVVLLAGNVLIGWRKRLSGRWQERFFYTEAVLCAVFGLTLSAAAGWMVHDAGRQFRQESFSALARAQAGSVVESLRGLRYQLSGLGRFLESSQQVDHEEFRSYAGPLARESLALAWEWIPAVTAEDLPQFEVRARQEGLTDFAAWQQDTASGRVPAAGRRVYYPVLYAEPPAGNEQVFGHDLGSESLRFSAVKEAEYTGMATCTDPVTLVEETGEQQGILVVRPVFYKSVKPWRLLGFVVTVLRLDTVVRQAIVPFDNPESGVSADLFLLEAGRPPRLLAASSLNEAGRHDAGKGFRHADFAGLSVTLPLFIFGRAYALVIRPEPAYLAVHPLWSGWATGLAGLLLTVVLTAFVAFFINRRASLERQVQNRTMDLSRSEERFRSVFEKSPVGIAVVNTVNHRFVQANDHFCTMVGYSPVELDDLMFEDVIHPEDRKRELNLFRDYLDGKIDTFEQEGRYLRKDGEIRWLNMIGEVIHVNSGTTPLAVINVTDISGRKRAEEALQALSARQTALLSAIPDIIMETDVNKVYTWANHAGYEFFGEDVIGKTADFYFDGVQNTYEKVQPLFNGEENVIYLESLQRRRDGKNRLLAWWCRVLKDEQGNVTGALSSARDITSQRAVEEQLLQAQKMESVGRLAGGVAHDFNNKLGVIIGYVEMAMDQIDSALPLYDDLQEIRRAAQRSADLTRQLLAFARKQTVSPRVLDLNEAVSGMLKMLQRLIGENIEIVWKPGPDLWTVKMDPAQIDQILTNLSLNARDAIDGVGKLTIETENVLCDETFCEVHAGFIPGEFVLLAVSDTGAGMNKEVLGHLFEPFFTTKEVGKGTGLGLATVYGIVKQNNGFINVYSEPDEGTTVKVYLPRVQASHEAAFCAAVAKEPGRRTETVLLVEDEAAILNLGRSALKRYGYTVLAAGTPGEALVLAQRHEGPIHLLITDVVMPEMNGKDLQDKLTALRPGIKVLFISGYTADVIARHGLLEENVNFLQKPFSVNILASKVREVLDQK